MFHSSDLHPRPPLSSPAISAPRPGYYCSPYYAVGNYTCRSTEQLVASREEGDEGVELNDVGAANSQLNAILRDQTWVKNAA